MMLDLTKRLATLKVCIADSELIIAESDGFNPPEIKRGYKLLDGVLEGDTISLTFGDITYKGIYYVAFSYPTRTIILARGDIARPFYITVIDISELTNAKISAWKIACCIS